MNAAIVIPYYRHEGAIAQTLASLQELGLPCWVVDDGSGPDAAAALDAAAHDAGDWVRVLRLARNRGKGMAVMTGFEALAAAGFTHGVQIDADGQHDAGDVPRLLAAAAAQPQAVVTGVPVYDASVPKSRLYGRYVTHVWVWINTLSFEIRDSMCGFRVYPLAPTLALWRSSRIGRRMDFDTEILVRLYWRGLRVVSVPTRVTYPLDGVSHFQLWRDNLRISWMHARLFFGMLWRAPRLLMRSAARP